MRRTRSKRKTVSRKALDTAAPTTSGRLPRSLTRTPLAASRASRSSGPSEDDDRSGGPVPGDRVLEAERLHGDRLEEPLVVFDRAQAPEAVDRGHGALLPPDGRAPPAQDTPRGRDLPLRG